MSELREERSVQIKYIEGLERDREEVKTAMKILNRAGVAAGNERGAYSLSERIEWITSVLDFYRRKSLSEKEEPARQEIMKP